MLIAVQMCPSNIADCSDKILEDVFRHRSIKTECYLNFLFPVSPIICSNLRLTLSRYNEINLQI